MLVVVILFGVFLLVKAIRKYRESKYNKQYWEMVEKRAKERQKEDDLKFELFKHIFHVENHPRVEEVQDWKPSPDRLLYGFESNEEDSTYHCSCKYGEEECIGCQNGNISEISYCNDVSPRRSTQTLYHKKMKEYLALFMHNSYDCSQFAVNKEREHVKKKLSSFEKNYQKVRDEILTQACKGYFEHHLRNDLSKSMLNQPSKRKIKSKWV